MRHRRAQTIHATTVMARRRSLSSTPTDKQLTDAQWRVIAGHGRPWRYITHKPPRQYSRRCASDWQKWHTFALTIYEEPSVTAGGNSRAIQTVYLTGFRAVPETAEFARALGGTAASDDIRLAVGRLMFERGRGSTNLDVNVR